MKPTKPTLLCAALLALAACGDDPAPRAAATAPAAPDATVPAVQAPTIREPAIQAALPTARAPLPVFLPDARPLPALGAPLPRTALRVPLSGGRVLAPAEAVPELALDDGWRCSGLSGSATPFADDAQLDRGFHDAAFDDRGWAPIAVPLDWYRAFPAARSAKAPYVIGWYRRELTLDAAQAARRGVLHFGVVGYEAELWVNGAPAGSHHGDFTPWEADIGGLLRPGRNVLALRVRSDVGPAFGAHGPARHVYGSQWSISNIKGGLWQPVRLRLEQPVRVASLLLAPRVADGAVQLDWRIANGLDRARRVALRAVVQDARDGMGGAPRTVELGTVELQPGDNRGTATAALAGLKRWTPDAPYLHWLTLVAEDTESHDVVAARSERFGFREFTVAANPAGARFLLNGEPVYLAGLNLRAIDFGGTGRTAEADAAFIDAQLGGLKANGVNIVRVAHMPADPALLDRADELGVMIYDEWGWSFTDELDPQEFAKRNDAELAEWVERDHNHPAVVMWSCGNEVHYDRPEVRAQLDRQVAAVRTLDRARRPVGAFSGAAFGYGRAPLAGDLIDLHDYLGLSGPWTGWEGNQATVRHFLAGAYGADWNARMPFIVWECIGFSWGEGPDRTFAAGDPAAYLERAQRPTAWGAPNGIGFAGTLGLAAALDPARGTAEGRRTYGRRIAERIRRDPAVAGFAPWFHDTALADQRQWTQPVFASLAGADGRAVRHPLAGRELEQTLLVDNRGTAELRGAHAVLSLVGAADGAERELTRVELPPLAADARCELPLRCTLPPTDRAGWWQLRVRVVRDGTDVARLGYDLFTAPGDAARAPLPAAVVEGAPPIALLPGAGAGLVRRWLGDLGLAVRDAAGPADLAGAVIAIVPPGASGGAFGDGSERLRAWVQDGGRLAVLEQAAGTLAAPGLTAVPAKNTFIDLVVPAHPLFAGLEQAAFDTSDRPGGGLWIAAGLGPLTLNVLAARGPFLGSSGVSAAVAEGRLGRGRILASQVLALELWDRDSAATLYLRNLAARLLRDVPAGELRPWVEPRTALDAVAARCVPLDLRAAANRGFADERADDGTGGWTDQGANDFRMMPLGAQTLHGVPFTIIDPAANSGHGCVVLGGAGRPGPAQVSVSLDGGPVSRLFILHTAAWVGGSGGLALTYRVRYADGTVADIPARAGQEIADWWNPGELPHARLGLTRSTAEQREVGLFLMPWDNPRPEVGVRAIELVGGGTMVPIIVAITAERPAASVRFTAPGAAPAWRTLVDRRGMGPESRGPGLPTATAADDAPGGGPAALLAFPAPLTGEYPVRVPSAFIALSTDERAKLATATCTHLTFWLKAEGRGTLNVVLPRQDWKAVAETTIQLDPAAGWHKVRLALDADLHLGRGGWTVADLRGELFLFNGRDAAAGETSLPAVSVRIADPRLE